MRGRAVMLWHVTQVGEVELKQGDAKEQKAGPRWADAQGAEGEGALEPMPAVAPEDNIVIREIMQPAAVQRPPAQQPAAAPQQQQAQPNAQPNPDAGGGGMLFGGAPIENIYEEELFDEPPIDAIAPSE